MNMAAIMPPIRAGRRPGHCESQARSPEQQYIDQKITAEIVIMANATCFPGQGRQFSIGSVKHSRNDKKRAAPAHCARGEAIDRNESGHKTRAGQTIRGHAYAYQ
jgi:hypothetical protein